MTTTSPRQLCTFLGINWRSAWKKALSKKERCYCYCTFQLHAESEILVTTNSGFFCCCLFKFLYIGDQWTMKNGNLQNGSKSNNHGEELNLFVFREFRYNWLTAVKNATVGGDLNFRFHMLLKSAVENPATYLQDKVSELWRMSNKNKNVCSSSMTCKWPGIFQRSK